jgi:hypothetical protein
MDIKNIPTEELRKDLQEGRDDIANCKAALEVGYVNWSGGSIQVRIDTNKRINEKIEAELTRRGEMK